MLFYASKITKSIYYTRPANFFLLTHTITDFRICTSKYHTINKYYSYFCNFYHNFQWIFLLFKFTPPVYLLRKPSLSSKIFISETATPALISCDNPTNESDSLGLLIKSSLITRKMRVKYHLSSIHFSQTMFHSNFL